MVVTVVHRPSDGERVGWLAPDGDGLVQPVDLVGSPRPAGPAGDLLLAEPPG